MVTNPLALSNRGALSIFDASFTFAGASYLVSGQTWSTVRMEQRAFGGTLSLSLRWLHLCICSDAPEKGFALAVEVDPGGLQAAGARTK